MGVEGTVVVITGGAAGVGRYISRNFAAAGAKVVVADISPMDTVLGEVSALGGEGIGVTTDVSNEDSVRHLFDEVYRKYGRIDTLINDAGIVTHFHVGSPRWSRIRDMNRDFFAKVLETNLFGTFLCCKHAIPYMESLGAGHIINFGQGNVSRKTGPVSIGACAYHTSKVAIRAFTIDLAEEERDFGICIMSMGPGSSSNAAPGEHAVGGIVTDDSPAWVRDPSVRGTDVDKVGDRYLLAAQADMSFSGAQVSLRGGQLVVVED